MFKVIGSHSFLFVANEIVFSMLTRYKLAYYLPTIETRVITLIITFESMNITWHNFILRFQILSMSVIIAFQRLKVFF
jgi:hypothetical protein